MTIGHGQPKVSCTVSVFSIHEGDRLTMTDPQITPEAVVWVAVDVAKDKHETLIEAWLEKLEEISSAKLA
jgi:hypothetical protein